MHYAPITSILSQGGGLPYKMDEDARLKFWI